MAYPDSLSNVPDAPAGTETLGGTTPTHSEAHQLLADAVNETQSTLGLNPEGDYATAAARLDALDLAAFDPVSYGAVVDGVTDDTVAWQAAINACGAAGGGVVRCSKPGVSVIGGALQETGGANAQLLLPAVDAVDSEQISVTLAGPFQAPSVVSVIGSTPVPDNHLVLKSTLASGTGAVIGAQGPAGTYNGFTNVHLRVENLTVRTVSNPTLSGLDLRQVASVDLDGVVVDCGGYHVSGVTEPTTATSYGIRLPKNNNGTHVRLGMVDVIGFYTGYEFAEHATGGKVAAWGCKVAAEFDATNHASVFLRFMAVWCERGLKFTGAHAVDVWQFDIEHASSGWYTTDYDLDDASNLGKGFLRWWAVLAGTGAHNSFTKNGGTGFTTSRVGDALGSGGGGGSTVYVHRDSLTAAADNDTLTLGASPVAGSPLLWVDGAIQWPGVDYSITDAVISFLTPLVGGEVVQVHYQSTTSTYTAATLSGDSVSIADDFNRSDSTSSLGSTSTGAFPWTAHSGTWGINTNRAYVSAGHASQTNIATIDSTVADGVVSITPVAGGGVYGGIAFRLASAGNCYVLEFQVGSTYAWKIYKGVGGSYTTLATGPATALAISDVVTVELAGSSITVKKNGTTVMSTTDTTYQTATRHGLYIVTSSTSALRLDSFAVTS